MSLKYPISFQELNQINGVGEGKAKRYGAKFIELIKNYVDENEIIRPDDLIIKSTGANSALKLYLIQSIDRKLSLLDIASAKGMNMNRLITEMETIVFSGTKLNIDYWINDLFDEDQIEELTHYFMEADSDDLHLVSEEFDGDYEDEELRLFRLKFISDVGN
jgi:ATP-dependent DNA helicase RecQ